MSSQVTEQTSVELQAWINFLRIVNKTWICDSTPAPIVLLGDAAHTAHFSVGSGTKLALEDAIALASSLQHRVAS